MNAAPTLIIAGAPLESARRLEKSLGRRFGIRFLGEDVSAVARDGEASQAALIILCVDGAPEAVLQATRDLAEQEIRVLILGREKNADLILGAMRAGACEFIVDGRDEELRQAASDLVQRSSGEASGTVTCVFPAKGGVGATALATNLADALHRSGDERVCLLDLDLHFGDVLSFLDVQGAYSISDVIANIQRLDRELLDSSVTRHSSGVYLMAQSEKLDQAENISGDDIATLLGFLRQHYDQIVVDGLRGLNDVALAALDDCDRILLVVTQDVPAVRNAQRCISIFERLAYSLDKVTLIVNRFQRKSDISLDVISETAGVPAEVTIANDFAAVIKTINRGVMLSEEAPRSRLTKNIADLTPLIHGQRSVHIRRTGIFGAMFARKTVTDGAQ